VHIDLTHDEHGAHVVRQVNDEDSELETTWTLSADQRGQVRGVLGRHADEVPTVEEAPKYKSLRPIAQVA
jgi:hypothetical protein